MSKQEVFKKCTHMEWFSKSLDKICSFISFAFFANFFRIAEEISPVTDMKLRLKSIQAINGIKLKSY